MERELMEWSNKEVASVKVVQTITQEDINYIICGWLESSDSILYAIGKKNGFVKDTDIHNQFYWSDYATKILLDGGTLIVDDTSELKQYELTLEKLLKGIELNANERKWDNYFNNNHDSITYDCIIQYAIFGELIYG